MTREQSDKIYEHLVNFLGDPGEAVTALCAIWDRTEEIIMGFNFKKVRRAMKALDWHWAQWIGFDMENHYNEVPDVYALRAELYRLMIDALVGNTCVATGGFEVCWSYSDDHILRNDDGSYEIWFPVKFVLTETE